MYLVAWRMVKRSEVCGKRKDMLCFGRDDNVLTLPRKHFLVVFDCRFKKLLGAKSSDAYRVRLSACKLLPHLCATAGTSDAVTASLVCVSMHIMRYKTCSAW